jgi:integrase
VAVYRPSYTDPKTGEKKVQRIFWYHFTYAGRHIQESSKSTRKTVAVEAEKKRRRELEKSFNGIEDNRKERVRTMADVAEEFMTAYAVRNPQSKTFAEYAVRHVARLLGGVIVVDIGDVSVKDYQTARLNEKASPKSINEEVGFLLRILGEQGDILRARLKRQHALKLKVKKFEAVAYTSEQKADLLAAAKLRRSRAIYPALMLALHAGMRDAEIREVQLGRVDLQKRMIRIGDAKSDAGQGRTIPLNADVHAALVEYFKWYVEKFGETKPEWYLFPFGQPQPTDPTRPVTTLKTSWGKVRAVTGVKGRWHDNRHTWVTDLAESPDVSDGTIMAMAGHVSKEMLKHYSHTRTAAKRRAVESLTVKAVSTADYPENSFGAAKESAKVEEND